MMCMSSENLQVITMGLANVSESSTVVDANELLAGLADAAKEMEPGTIPLVVLRPLSGAIQKNIINSFSLLRL